MVPFKPLSEKTEEIISFLSKILKMSDSLQKSADLLMRLFDEFYDRKTKIFKGLMGSV